MWAKCKWMCQRVFCGLLLVADIIWGFKSANQTLIMARYYKKPLVYINKQ